MKIFISVLFSFCWMMTKGQELFVYTEPASNMPAHSLSAKLSADYIASQSPENRPMQRYTPEVMLGVSKKIMLHTGLTFADMFTERFRWESVYVYGKYRFLSHDDIHTHFRMAFFADLAYSRNKFHYDEVNLRGDKSGAQLGVIATQLWNKLAVSATVSNSQVLSGARGDKPASYNPSRIYQSMNYSLSAGYLLLPFEYTDYRQTNVNLYTELLAQQTLDRRTYYVDLAPAVQIIFNSNTKVNIGHRFQLKGDMTRIAENSWQVGVERTFLGVVKKRERK
ncbi:MAG TPA: hypothetical protein VK644_02150 [Chitinophagaceae bacterium]|jgi:hypothetical protein|nr:hypothetical protein [Chitinophagaceae bacterium]